ncbi:hypothetical protein KW787_00325 [Candidatus Pacearchaeota archaeon]|nr:hypothetical protein [Candidatus Pacearchaeota archaeon]
MRKKGQVWVETVIYTLIGLSLMGLALAFITPKLNQLRDKAVVEQAIGSLTAFDETINDVLTAPGNRRVVDFTMKRGELYFNSSGDEIDMVISGLGKPYSQPGVEIKSRVSILSVQEQKTSSVILRLRYTNSSGDPYVNLTYNDADTLKKFSAASIPYKFYVLNTGVKNKMEVVSITEASG